MKKTQPIRNVNKKVILESVEKRIKEQEKKEVSSNYSQVQNNKKYGISKLEADFAHNFLDKLGLKYIYEYEAKDIKKYFDFAVTAYTEVPFIMENKHGVNSIKQDGQNVPIAFIIEVDGSYW